MNKLSTFKRCFLTIAAYIAMLLSLLVSALMVLSLTTNDNYLQALKALPYLAYALIAFSVLLIVACFVLLNVLKKDKHEENFVVQAVDDGQLRISVDAIETIVKRTVTNQEKVQLLKQTVSVRKNQLKVKLVVQVEQGEAIPIAAAKLKKDIVSAISYSTGIENANVMIDAELSKEAKLLDLHQNQSMGAEKVEKEKNAELDEKADDAIAKQTRFVNIENVEEEK